MSTTPNAVPVSDERVRKLSFLQSFYSRPESASVTGAIIVFIVFILTAGDSGMFDLDGMKNWMEVAAFFGIIAVGASLLMIAGEFDLSIGSMIGFAGMLLAITTVHFGLPVWLGVLITFSVSMALGALNGYVVIKTGLPSFIVTLAFLFILRGLSLALSVLMTGRTIVGGVGNLVEQDWLISTFFAGDALTSFFQWLADKGMIETLSNGSPIIAGIPKVIFWWLLLAFVGAFILSKTRAGNWIQAAGGDQNATSSMGIPIKKVKISLFVFTAFCACLFAVIQVSDIGSAAADRGLLKEFEAIIAAVIGGCLLTGGYGSVIGASFGALIYGVVFIGIGYTDISSEWFRVFLGVMLLLAVLSNNFIRKRFTGEKK